MATLRIMLDTNAYDEIVERSGFTARLNAAHNEGNVVILRTHIQEDELASIPDEKKRAAVMQVAGIKVVTSGAVWDLSKWDESTFGGGAGDTTIGDVMSEAGNHVEDALIASTSAVDADVLVTDDRRLSNRVGLANSKLQVWSVDEFIAYVERL